MIPFTELLEKIIPCTCGKNHTVPIKKIEIAKGAINKITEIINELEFSGNCHLVYDLNTLKIAGITIKKNLTEKSIPFSETLFDTDNLMASPLEVNQVIDGMIPQTGCIIAIGSGTINDICRYAAYKTQKPYLIVATAPSMDGYASSVSPLIIDSCKTTFTAVPPTAIIGDIDILKAAPSQMIAAGFGDIIGKYTSLADWKLGALLCGEEYCTFIETLVRDAVNICVHNIDGLQNNEENAINELMNALILSGIAMLMAGNSRPASGAEHQLSHFWEMHFINQGGNQPLHGHKVGIACIIMADKYNRLCSYRSRKAEIEKMLLNHTEKPAKELKNQIKTIYGKAADAVIHDNFTGSSLFIDNQSILNNWDKIIAIAETVPSADDIRCFLNKINAPLEPGDLSINEELKNTGIAYCMYFRKKYNILRLYNRIGLI